MMMMRSLLTVAVLVTACSSVARAQNTVTLTFDEVEFQSVDGLSVSGVTFDFKVQGADSDEAFYASFGPGTLQYVDDPSLTGDANGVLSLDFAFPTSIVRFGAALSTGNDLDPGLEVSLYDTQLNLLQTIPLVTSASGALGFSEALFDYQGAAVSRVVVDFTDGPQSFALDNLVYEVPEPAAWVLVAAGLMATVRTLRRRK